MINFVGPRNGFSEASYYLWRSKFGGMTPSDTERLRVLETENGRLKRLLADQGHENDVVMEILGRVVTAPARGLGVKGLSERRALLAVRMSASAYRYAPRSDGNDEPREQNVALAAQRRSGTGATASL